MNRDDPRWREITSCVLEWALLVALALLLLSFGCVQNRGG
jgi:hypothetical protein